MPLKRSLVPADITVYVHRRTQLRTLTFKARYWHPGS